MSALSRPPMLAERMPVEHRRHARIALFEPKAELRGALFGVLEEQGFRQARAVGRVDALRDLLMAEPVDLVIADAESEDGAAVAVLRALRRGHTQASPFATVIQSHWSLAGFHNGPYLEAGADLILLKPVSGATLISRIALAAMDRKPFIATPRYVGPERRSNRRGGAEPVPVPNPLLDALTGISAARGKADGVVEEDTAVSLQRLVLSGLEAEARVLFGLAALLEAEPDAATPGETLASVEAILDTLWGVVAQFSDRLFAELKDAVRRLVLDLRHQVRIDLGDPRLAERSVGRSDGGPKDTARNDRDRGRPTEGQGTDAQDTDASVPEDGPEDSDLAFVDIDDGDSDPQDGGHTEAAGVAQGAGLDTPVAPTLRRILGRVPMIGRLHPEDDDLERARRRIEMVRSQGATAGTARV